MQNNAASLFDRSEYTAFPYAVGPRPIDKFRYTLNGYYHKHEMLWHYSDLYKLKIDIQFCLKEYNLSLLRQF